MLRCLSPPAFNYTATRTHWLVHRIIQTSVTHRGEWKTIENQLNVNVYIQYFSNTVFKKLSHGYKNRSALQHHLLQRNMLGLPSSSRNVTVESSHTSYSCGFGLGTSVIGFTLGQMTQHCCTGIQGLAHMSLFKRCYLNPGVFFQSKKLFQCFGSTAVAGDISAPLSLVILT